MSRPTIRSTIELAKRLHDGQFDDCGDPYWMHPVSVMELLPDDVSDDERLAALLHDAIDDTDADEAMLGSLEYSDRVIWLVVMLSRSRASPGMTYMDEIRAIAATGDAGLIVIKHRDNLRNSDPARTARIMDAERRRIRMGMAQGRYARSRRILVRALETLGKSDWIVPAVSAPAAPGEATHRR